MPYFSHSESPTFIEQNSGVRIQNEFCMIVTERRITNYELPQADNLEAL
jgi:hypothetical protein